MRERFILRDLMKAIKSIKSTTIAFLANWAIFAALVIALRVVRIQFQTVSFGLLGKYVYVSDIIFLLALLLIGLILTTLIRNGSIFVHRLFLAGLIFFSLVLATVEVIACRFYVVSGGTIDAGLVRYTFENLKEVRWAVSTETPLWLSGGFVSGFIIFTFLPLFIIRKWDKKNAMQIVRKSKTPYFVLIPVVIAIAVFAFIKPHSLPAYGENANTLIAKTAVARHAEDEISGPKEKLFDTKNAKLKGDSKTNLVIILLESTRASATSMFPPYYPTTPFLKSLTQNSLWMSRAYPVVPHTSKALVSALCGIPPSTPMPIIESVKGGIPGRCLAELLKQKGYKSAFFQSAKQEFEGRPGLVENVGFNDFFPHSRLPNEGFMRVNTFGYEDDIMVEPTREWVKKNKDKPLFLTYLTLTPHHTYHSPDKYGVEKYSDKEKFNDYLNAVHYVDQFTKNIFQMFKDEGLYENTVFVIVGDHGEGFGEHGFYQHDSVIWEEGIHIPMIIHKSGEFEEGKKVNQVTNQLDILPTVLPMMGFEIEKGRYPGSDLRHVDEHEERMLFVHCWYDRKCLAAIKGNSKFIYHFGFMDDAFYDLEKDPLETKNLNKESISASWKKRALEWRSGVHEIYHEHAQGQLLSKKNND